VSIDPTQTARDTRHPPGAAAGPSGSPTDDPISIDHGDEPSLSDLISHLIDDLSRLMRQEVELAKTELRRDLTQAGNGSGMLVAGAVAAFIALLLALFAAAWGLAAIMPAGFAFLIVAVVVGALAAGAIAAGRKRLKQVDLTPRATIESVQRDQHVIAERSPR
jgi:hypothetical protein